MPKPSIQTSIHGRRFGLSAQSDLVVNDANAGKQDAVVRVQARAYVTVPNASVLALNATPFEIIPAPGAGKIIVVNRMVVSKAAGTAFAVGAGEDLQLQYVTSNTAVLPAVDADGFADSTADEIRLSRYLEAAVAALDLTANANDGVELTLLVGEWITGTSDLIVDVDYEIFDTVLT